MGEVSLPIDHTSTLDFLDTFNETMGTVDRRNGDELDSMVTEFTGIDLGSATPRPGASLTWLPREVFLVVSPTPTPCSTSMDTGPRVGSRTVGRVVKTAEAMAVRLGETYKQFITSTTHDSLVDSVGAATVTVNDPEEV